MSFFSPSLQPTEQREASSLCWTYSQLNGSEVFRKDEQKLTEGRMERGGRGRQKQPRKKGIHGERGAKIGGSQANQEQATREEVISDHRAHRG